MLGLLLTKELRSILLSQKVIGTLTIIALLMILSTILGVAEYRFAHQQYVRATTLAEEKLSERTNWHMASLDIHREPDPLQILIAGTHYDQGRFSPINQQQAVELRQSPYSDDPLFSLFRMVDFAFVVTIVISLFALLFTFDAVSGERESGTLKLMMSNAIARRTLVLAKGLGAWLGLVLPLGVPILISMLIIVLSGVTLTTGDWTRIAMVIGVGLLTTTVFVMLGLFFSSVTRSSQTSFLLSLISWIAFVLILPKLAIVSAGQIQPVASAAEIAATRNTYSEDMWNSFYRSLEDRFDFGDEGLSDEERDTRLWERMEEQNALRDSIRTEIESFDRTLRERWRNEQRQQQTLAFALAKVSPVGLFQLATQRLSGTDVDVKSRQEQAMTAYREDFLDFAQQKVAEDPQAGTVSISISTESGTSIRGDRDRTRIDVSEMPRYQQPEVGTGAQIASVLPDIGILGLMVLLLAGMTVAGIHRYDVR